MAIEHDDRVPGGLEVTQDDRTWALGAHLAGPVGALASAGLLGVVAPLVIWLVKRDDSAFIEQHAKEALNFQITLFLLAMLLIVLSIATLGIGLLVAIPALLVLWVVEVLLGIFAAIAAYDGKPYRYPFTLRLVS